MNGKGDIFSELNVLLALKKSGQKYLKLKKIYNVFNT